MQNPLQITFHDMKHIAEIETLIEEKFEKVKAENPDVTKCHVVLEKLSKHHQKGVIVGVSFDLKIPHFEDIVVKEDSREDMTAIKSAVLKVFKQGIDLTRKHKKRRLDHKRVSIDKIKSAKKENSVEE